ncbi:hypothetical protein GN244_ATG18409 [Phytophthora infestans]|uniref:Uncharacterized protein n=1 Tax=Phytophthora infestans TaxID=4787 RepID=A0A833SNZ7_PHYIN|nr:hypothetical protein GN244_ATG18409 [Phytophthora infestans]
MAVRLALASRSQAAEKSSKLSPRTSLRKRRVCEPRDAWKMQCVGSELPTTRRQRRQIILS